jgi:hypothetical protein
MSRWKFLPQDVHFDNPDCRTMIQTSIMSPLISGLLVCEPGRVNLGA